MTSSRSWSQRLCRHYGGSVYIGMKRSCTAPPAWPGLHRLFSNLHHGWLLLPTLFSLEQTYLLRPPLRRSPGPSAVRSLLSAVPGGMMPCRDAGSSWPRAQVSLGLVSPCSPLATCCCMGWIWEERAEIGRSASQGVSPKQF